MDLLHTLFQEIESYIKILPGALQLIARYCWRLIYDNTRAVLVGFAGSLNSVIKGIPIIGSIKAIFLNGKMWLLAHTFGTEAMERHDSLPEKIDAYKSTVAEVMGTGVDENYKEVCKRKGKILNPEQEAQVRAEAKKLVGWCDVSLDGDDENNSRSASDEEASEEERFQTNRCGCRSRKATRFGEFAP